MGLTNHGILDVVDLVYYVPALPLALVLVFRHGFGRSSGWIFLVVLALLRIIGAATGLENINHPSKNLLETSSITYGIGVTPLLLAALGILTRVNRSMRVPRISPTPMRLASIPVTIGLIFSILGGLDEFNVNPDTVNNGYRDLKIGTAIYAVSFILFALMTGVLLMSVSSVLPSERKLIYVVLVSLPFLGIRIAYSLLTAFDHDSIYFSTTSNDSKAVVTQGLLSVAMEFIIVGLYLLAGLTTTAPREEELESKQISPPLSVQPSMDYPVPQVAGANWPARHY